MKVAFGVTLLAKGQANSGIDGIGHYVKELHHSIQNNQSVELMPYSFGYEYIDTNFEVKTKKLSVYYQHLISGFFIPPLRIQRFKHEAVDLVHATDHLVPLVKSVPLVATIMDAIPLSFPESLGNRNGYVSKAKFAFWAYVTRRADRIITISEYSKNEISEYFKIPLDRISVVPLAVESRFFTKIPDADKVSIRKTLNVPDHFFLSVGTLQPRKNLSRVLEAMKLLPLNLRKESPLVVVGRVGWSVQDLEKKIDEAVQEGWCIRLNRISDFELRVLMQSANALIFPSLAEGFGLPVLEAYASKLPVITSNTTSLPEVSSGSAILVNPINIKEIYEAIRFVLDNKSAIEPMVESGFNHALNMSWSKCAESTISIYKQLI